MRRLAATALVSLALAAGGAPAAQAAASPGPEAIDARFASCGLQQAPVPVRAPGGYEGRRVALGADGSAIAAGTAGINSSFAHDSIVLERLLPDGSVDRSFGEAGMVVARVPRRSPRQRVTLTGLAIGGDGKVVLGATVQNTEELTATAAVLARFNADGTPDGSFGSGGFVVETLGAGAAEVADLVLAPDGAIFAAGIAFDREARLVVARFNAGGVRDVAFGANGVAAPDFGVGPPDTARLAEGRVPAAVRLLADGRILLGGRAGEQFALTRLMPDGDLDRSFGVDGVNVSSPPASSAITAMDLDGQGRIVVAGTASNINGENQLALARYLPDGALDPSFGAEGFVVDRSASSPVGLASLPDGKVLVAGAASLGLYLATSGLLRYRSDGKRDAAFGYRGALGSFSGDTSDLVVARDGTALTAQTTSKGRVAVTRFAIGEPALGAIAGQPRACAIGLTVKGVGELLRLRGQKRRALLRVGIELTRPGAVALRVTVRVGDRRAKLQSTIIQSRSAGRYVAELVVGSRAAQLLRGARRARLEVSARGTDGGAVTTTSRTLGP